MQVLAGPCPHAGGGADSTACLGICSPWLRSPPAAHGPRGSTSAQAQDFRPSLSCAIAVPVPSSVPEFTTGFPGMAFDPVVAFIVQLCSSSPSAGGLCPCSVAAIAQSVLLPPLATGSPCSSCSLTGERFFHSSDMQKNISHGESSVRSQLTLAAPAQRLF